MELIRLQARGVDLSNGDGGKVWYPKSDLPIPDHTDDPKTTERIANEAVKFIDEHKDKPFFAYLPFLAVHTPIGARPSLVAKYNQKAKSAPHVAFGHERESKVRLVQNDPEYAGMLEQLDSGIGRVLEAVEKNGLTQKTIIVFFSDNGGLSTMPNGGPTSNLPLRAGKGWPYEGGVREPLIVIAPGVTTPGSTCDTPVISNDFYPTLLQLARLDLKPKQHLDGVSFAPLLKGENMERGPLFWHYPHYHASGGRPNGAIRDGDWKLIEWFEAGTLELYNLTQDMSEKNNLAAQQPDKVKELHEKLIAWRKEVGAIMPTPKGGSQRDRSKKDGTNQDQTKQPEEEL